MKKFTVVLLFSFLMFSCTTPRKELIGCGLFGEHNLNRIEQFSSNSGRINGGLFFGITGTLDTESMLQFYWEPKTNEIIATSLPKSKFRFIIDESRRVPTIELNFSSVWMDSKLEGGNYYGINKEEINLNDIISDHLNLAIVRISKADLEKEIYLPKVN